MRVFMEFGSVAHFLIVTLTKSFVWICKCNTTKVSKSWAIVSFIVCEQNMHEFLQENHDFYENDDWIASEMEE